MTRKKKGSKNIDEVKEREFSGILTMVVRSFELLANRLLGKVPEYLKVESYNVNVSKSKNISTKERCFFDRWKKNRINGEGNVL